MLTPLLTQRERLKPAEGVKFTRNKSEKEREEKKTQTLESSKARVWEGRVQPSERVQGDEEEQEEEDEEQGEGQEEKEEEE